MNELLILRKSLWKQDHWREGKVLLQLLCWDTDWDACALFKISGLPDEKGRFQILHIHTVRMREHQLLAEDVDIAELAVETKNFSGAELEGLVRAAQSTAMNRHIKVSPIISCWREGKRKNMWSLFLYVYFQMDNVISAPSILEEDCLAFFHLLLIMGGQCIFKWKEVIRTMKCQVILIQMKNTVFDGVEIWND